MVLGEDTEGACGEADGACMEQSPLKLLLQLSEHQSPSPRASPLFVSLPVRLSLFCPCDLVNGCEGLRGVPCSCVVKAAVGGAGAELAVSARARHHARLSTLTY